jgi:hypothetical protein
MERLCIRCALSTHMRILNTDAPAWFAWGALVTLNL